MMSKKAINIRRFKKSDRAAVNELLQTFHDYTKVNVLGEQMVKILASRRDTCALVAEVEENSKKMVVGFGMINFSPVADKNGFVGSVESVVVNPNYHGFGFAGKLRDELITTAVKRYAKEIHLTCNPLRVGAHRLYEKGGLKIKGTLVRVLNLEKANKEEKDADAKNRAERQKIESFTIKVGRLAKLLYPLPEDKKGDG